MPLIYYGIDVALVNSYILLHEEDPRYSHLQFQRDVLKLLYICDWPQFSLSDLYASTIAAYDRTRRAEHRSRDGFCTNPRHQPHFSASFA